MTARSRAEANFPLLGPGHWVARVEMTIDLAARRRRDLEVGADIQLGLWGDHRRRLQDFEGHTPFLAELVIEARLRVVGTGVEADATRNVWA